MGARRLYLGFFLGLAATAPAQGGDWYAGIQGGLTLVQDADNEDGGLTIETEHDPGFNIGGMVGYEFGNRFRLQGEIMYRENDVDELDVSDFDLGVNSIDGIGDVSALSFMAAGYYDFDVDWLFKPYVGGGIGFANVSLNDAGARAGGISVELADDDDTVFAYQLGAGLSYPLNPKLSISLDYRFFATADPELEDVDGDNFDTEYRSHNLGLNIRYRF